MRLGWFSSKKRSVPLDVAPLKKIIAVSDEYWSVLYQPLIDVTTDCFSVFTTSKDKLMTDYIDQFVKIARRNKGAVQEDPMLIHIQTYSLAVAFTALYLSRIMSEFECHSVSKSKKNIRERNIFFPWLNIPVNVEVRLKKVSHILPTYVYAFPILNQLLRDDIALQWLHSEPLIMKALYDAVMSNGENGLLSELLSTMQEPPLENSTTSVTVSNAVFANEEPPAEGNEQASLDDLISGLGGGDETPSLDQLLNNEITEKPQEKESIDKQLSGKSNDLDFSAFSLPEDVITDEKTELSSKEQKHSPESNEVVETTDSALDEFQKFIQSSSEDDDNTFKTTENQNSDDVVFSTSSSISEDLIKWCVNSVKSSMSGVSSEGVYAIEHEGIHRIAIDKSKAILAFVKSDYSLDSESDYQVVVDDVLTDLIMSSDWLPNENGGDDWKLSMKDSSIDVLLLNIELPSEIRICQFKLV